MDIHLEFRIREAVDADLCGNYFASPATRKQTIFGHATTPPEDPSRSSYIEHPVSRKVLRFLPAAQRGRSYGLLRQRNLDGAKDNPFGFDVQGTENRMPLASPRPRAAFPKLADCNRGKAPADNVGCVPFAGCSVILLQAKTTFPTASRVATARSNRSPLLFSAMLLIHPSACLFKNLTNRLSWLFSFPLSIRSDSENRIRQPVVGDGKVP
jgi:hypothetical protein